MPQYARNRFNAEVRPYLTDIPIGQQGIAFDRLDMDDWADDYKRCNGRLGQFSKGKPTWDAKECQVSSNEVGNGTSISTSEAGAFAKALKQLDSTRRSRS
jgi:hypothetical protein